MQQAFRAPAVPLITVDPYFSLWSFADRLTDCHTTHWTGRITPAFGLLEIDGEPFRWLGRMNPDLLHLNHAEYPAMDQVSLNIRPLSTVCRFEKNGVRLEVRFMTPLLPDDLHVASRPVSYVSYSLSSLDGKPHRVRLDFGVSAYMTVNDLSEKITLGRTDFSVCVGKGDRDVLSDSGDDRLIDWGTLHLVYTDHDACLVPRDELCFPHGALRRPFPRENRLLAPGTVQPASKSPFLFLSKEFELTPRLQTGFFALAYDDVHSIEYFGKKIDAYYKKDGDAFEDAVAKAIAEYPAVRERAESFEEDLLKKARRIGEKYADVVSLAYRQAFAAHKLCSHEGETLFFSKECFSNGCIATVDVTYPSIPLFLIYNPELVKGMLEPIFRFADSPAWNFDYAPHDVGTYPLANLQVYGLNRKLGYLEHAMQMPVEECGNMILCAAAVCRAEKSPAYALSHRVLLEKWVSYLAEKGLDPENQLCTDDFAGRLAHNVNLSAKAVVAIGAWGMILDMAGEDGGEYTRLARGLAQKWKAMAFDGDHYRLAFDREGTWSIKYNLVWDRLFGLGLFDGDVFETEIAFYKTKINPCGLPLDSRSDYTKSDWQMWSVLLADDAEYRDAIVGAMWNMLCVTEDRVPFTDWYYTATGRQAGFQNRTVQGGLFLPLLKF